MDRQTQEELQRQMREVRHFSADIRTDFGLEKFAKTVLKKGKLVHSQYLISDFNRAIQQLEQGKTNKYLRTEESKEIQHQQMKERLKKKYTRRLRMILKSELHAKNIITASGTFAVSVLRYRFGIINWGLEEITEIDRKTKKLLVMYKM